MGLVFNVLIGMQSAWPRNSPSVSASMYSRSSWKYKPTSSRMTDLDSVWLD